VNLSYEVFVNDPPPQDNGLLPNGEPRLFSPQASTLIYGREDAVLTDPGMTADQALALGDWVAGKGRNLTDIFITHGHGDHWFAAGLLADRFGARVVATAGTIAQMHANVATRPLLWDKVYPGIPPATVTASVPNGSRTGHPPGEPNPTGSRDTGSTPRNSPAARSRPGAQTASGPVTDAPCSRASSSRLTCWRAGSRLRQVWDGTTHVLGDRHRPSSSGGPTDPGGRRGWEAALTRTGRVDLGAPLASANN
jgi:hypothetical protein